MKGIALTPKQSQTLEIIRRHVRVRKLPPSRSEIARELGVRHQASVDQQLAALARKGWIKLLAGVDRGIQLQREGAPLLDPDQLPEVRAGTPIVVEEEAPPVRLHDYDSVTAQFAGRPDYFLRVQGDSMDRVGFRSGDIVAVQREREPREGDVIVARIGDSITLKRFKRRSADLIELQPESSNNEHGTIKVGPDDDFEIVGVVVGAIVGGPGLERDSDAEPSPAERRSRSARKGVGLGRWG